MQDFIYLINTTISFRIHYFYAHQITSNKNNDIIIQQEKLEEQILLSLTI